MTINRWLTIIMVAIAAAETHAQIVINEVMQSNVNGIMDDLNDFPDSWVELYNSGATPVDVAGYGLSVKNKAAKAYRLPSAIVPAHGYLLVYCDKVGSGLHADFRVDSGKGDVYLFDASGSVVDQVTMAKQPAPDIAYGRVTDGADGWGYQLTPSPGGANSSGVSDKLLPEVTFSEQGGVWSDARGFTLTLSVADAPDGVRIIYTNDGREP